MIRPHKMQSAIRLLGRFVLMMGLFAGQGCGSESDLLGLLGQNRTESRRTQNPAAIPQKETPGQTSEEAELDRQLARTLPVETFLLGMRELPTRLKATSLVLNFRSNMMNAVFECRTAASASWEICPLGSKYRIASLKHGQTIALWVRAKGVDGRVDTTPLMLGTLVDLQDGVTVPNAIEQAADELPLVRADQLPAELDKDPNSAASGAGEAQERKVMVGSFYGAVVPWQMYVATYSTSKTYNASLQILRVLGRTAGSAYDGERCDRNFERVVAGALGLQYCEATPERNQMDTAYARPMPYNHVELVFARDFGEKIMIAAFDKDQDPYEARLGIDHVCQASSVSGAQAVPLLNEFFGVEPAREMLSWCQVRAADGAYWWVGMVSAALTAKPDAPRIKIIYSVKADRGILSGQQFSSRAAAVLTKVIVPIAAIPE